MFENDINSDLSFLDSVSRQMSVVKRQQDTLDRDRDKYLNDVNAISKDVAARTSIMLPPGAKVKTHGLLPHEAVDASFKDNDPLKGVGKEVVNTVTSLAGQKIAGNPTPEVITQKAFDAVVGERKLDSYIHKLKQDTSIFGEAAGTAPGYDEFKKEFDSENKPDVAAYYKGVTPSGVATNLGIAAGFNVAAEGIGRVGASLGLKGIASLAGRGLFGLPTSGTAGLVTKGIGLALMTAADFAVMDAASEAVKQSSWAAARSDEPIKVGAVEVAAGFGSGLTMAPLLKGVESKVTSSLKEYALDKVRNEAAAKVLDDTGTISSLMDFHKSLKTLERSKNTSVWDVDNVIMRNKDAVAKAELDATYQKYNPEPPEGHSLFSAEGISRMREKERIRAAEEAMGVIPKNVDNTVDGFAGGFGVKGSVKPPDVTGTTDTGIVPKDNVIPALSSTPEIDAVKDVTERGLVVRKIGVPEKIADNGWLGTDFIEESKDVSFQLYTPMLEGRTSMLSLPAPVEKSFGSDIPLRGRVAMRVAFEQNKNLRQSIIQMGEDGPPTMTPQNMNKLVDFFSHHVSSSKIPDSLLGPDSAVVSTVKMTNERLLGRAKKFGATKKTATQTALDTGLEDASYNQKVKVLDTAGITEAKELTAEGLTPQLAVPLAASNSIARKVRKTVAKETVRDTSIVSATKSDLLEGSKGTTSLLDSPSKGEGLTLSDEVNLLKGGAEKSVPDIGTPTGRILTPEEIDRFKAAKVRQNKGALSRVFASKEEKLAADAVVGDIGNDVSSVLSSVLKKALITVPIASAAYVALNGDEAQAGTLGSTSALAVDIAKKAFGDNIESLVKSIKNSSLVADKGTIMGQVARWMDGISANSTLGAVKETSSKIPEWVRSKVLTPAVAADRFYKVESNPMTEWATRVTAIHNNTQMHSQAVKEILSMVPEYKSSTSAIAEATKPLTEKYEEPLLKQSYHTGMIQEVRQRLKGTNRVKEPEAYKDGIKELKTHISALRDAKIATQGYEADWINTMQDLTKDYSSARIALALEDTADFYFYPWLKGKMTPSELSAVSRLKDLNKVVAGRIEEAGGDVVKARPYAHHALHPDSNAKELQDSFSQFSLNPENALSLARLYSRKAGAKMMMPDVEYMYAKYIPDIERRIQGMKFWKKGEEGGWWSHIRELRTSGSMTPELNQFWEDVNKSLSSVYRSETANWVNRYYASEVLWRLFASPSVGFKHLMKQVGNLAIFPPDVWAKGVTKAPAIMLRAKALELQENFPKVFDSLGIKIKSNDATDLVRAVTNQGKYNNAIAELDMFDAPINKFDKILAKVNEAGSFIVGGVEAFDRTATVLMGLEMAAKKGMTPSQATFAVYDSILKTNFLSGAHNPAWVRDPYARAFFMFQGTPYKLAEQRFLMMEKAGKSLSSAAKETWNQLKELKSFIKEGEYRVKHGMIIDALTSEKDIFGQSTAKQFAVNSLIMGGLIGGVGATTDWDISDQVFHLPFVKFKGEAPGVMLNPVTSAAFKTWSKRHDEDRDLLFSEFFKNWSGSTGPVPSTFNKILRLKEDDIPEIYRNSKFRYLFSVPAAKE